MIQIILQDAVLSRHENYFEIIRGSSDQVGYINVLGISMFLPFNIASDLIFQFGSSLWLNMMLQVMISQDSVTFAK